MIYELRKQLTENGDDDDGIEMAMRVTGYKRNTIYKLVNLRQIPHSKHRGKLRFDKGELKEWAKGKARATSSSLTASRYSQLK